MKRKEKIFNHWVLDTHTSVICEDLTQAEKKEFEIEANLYAHFNEIGFATPVNSEAWKEDCFNIIVSETEDYDNIEVILLPISKLPKRLKATYQNILEKRQ